jgi:cytochrome c peroxidase
MSSRRAEPSGSARHRPHERCGRASTSLALVSALTLALAACGGGGGGSGDTSGEDPPDPPSVVDVRTLLRIPAHMELPAIPEFNPITRAKIDLGRKLFHDTRLSANQTQSCATCHDQARAFSDGNKTPTGSTGDVLERNSMGLANVAYLSTLTWASSSLRTLEDQIEIPILSDDPIELGLTDGVRDEVLARFDTDPEYAAMFADAFPESTGPVTVNKVIFALASFCRSLISGGSPYDRFLAGDDTALTEQQKRGFSLFNGEKFECFHCHTGTLLTTAYRDENTDPNDIRAPFFNNGLYNVDGSGGYPPYDQGLYDLTLDPDDRGLFRPASLRNVALTAPYMHDGSIATLRDVLRHYAAGGRNITSGPFAGDGRLSPLKSGLVRGFKASDEEIDAVLAFLGSLSDPEFLTDPAFAPPDP